MKPTPKNISNALSNGVELLRYELLSENEKYSSDPINEINPLFQKINLADRDDFFHRIVLHFGQTTRIHPHLGFTISKEAYRLLCEHTGKTLNRSNRKADRTLIEAVGSDKFIVNYFESLKSNRQFADSDYKSRLDGYDEKNPSILTKDQKNLKKLREGFIFRVRQILGDQTNKQEKDEMLQKHSAKIKTDFDFDCDFTNAREFRNFGTASYFLTYGQFLLKALYSKEHRVFKNNGGKYYFSHSEKLSKHQVQFLISTLEITKILIAKTKLRKDIFGGHILDRGCNNPILPKGFEPLSYFTSCELTKHKNKILPQKRFKEEFITEYMRPLKLLLKYEFAYFDFWEILEEVFILANKGKIFDRLNGRSSTLKKEVKWRMKNFASSYYGSVLFEK